jgi:hypothetical protein
LAKDGEANTHPLQAFNNASGESIIEAWTLTIRPKPAWKYGLYLIGIFSADDTMIYIILDALVAHKAAQER